MDPKQISVASERKPWRGPQGDQAELGSFLAAFSARVLLVSTWFAEGRQWEPSEFFMSWHPQEGWDIGWPPQSSCSAPRGSIFRAGEKKVLWKLLSAWCGWSVVSSHTDTHWLLNSEHCNWEIRSTWCLWRHSFVSSPKMVSLWTLVHKVLCVLIRLHGNLWVGK